MHAIFKLMNRLLIFFFLLVGFSPLNAQINELGIFLGGGNYIGDVGPTDYIAPNELAFGVLYKWNRSPRHAYRFSYTQSRLTARDNKASTQGRIQRDYDFQNSVKELSLGLEFNFFDFNLHQMERKITPYVYTGLSYAFYKEIYIENGTSEEDGSKGTLAIPMTVGIKSNITQSLILGFEVGARYTFTDNLDGSNPEDDKRLKFGNIDSKDWYVFSGFTLTYTFGEKPCYCVE